eukprot:5694511-Prymnesium_polylepis.1
MPVYDCIPRDTRLVCHASGMSACRVLPWGELVSSAASTPPSFASGPASTMSFTLGSFGSSNLTVDPEPSCCREEPQGPLATIRTWSCRPAALEGLRRRRVVCAASWPAP